VNVNLFEGKMFTQEGGEFTPEADLVKGQRGLMKQWNERMNLPLGKEMGK
jgi:hypothetical protein